MKLQKQLSKNQKIIFGGKFDLNDKFFEPTIVEIDNFKSKIMEDEIFGPILPILTYSSDDELSKILERENRVQLYKNCLKFLHTRVDLDLAFFKDDIWSH